MAEYIEREAALALYEDDAVDMSVLKVPVPVIIQNLKDVPAADVRPVVRCGECRYWTESSAIPTIGTCMFASIRHTAGFFCANGERKDGDEA